MSPESKVPSPQSGKVTIGECRVTGSNPPSSDPQITHHASRITPSLSRIPHAASRITRYLTIYAALWKNSITRETMFKGNFLLWIFVELLWFGLQLSFIGV